MSILTQISELTQVLYEICQVSKIPFLREVEIFFKRKKQNKLFMCNTFIKIKNKTLKQINTYEFLFIYLFRLDSSPRMHVHAYESRFGFTASLALD